MSDYSMMKDFDKLIGEDQNKIGHACGGLPISFVYTAIGQDLIDRAVFTFITLMSKDIGGLNEMILNDRITSLLYLLECKIQIWKLEQEILTLNTLHKEELAEMPKMVSGSVSAEEAGI